MKASTRVRLILSVILLYFVFTETGWATPLLLFLVMLNSEIQSVLSAQKGEKIRRLEAMMRNKIDRRGQA